jgi:mannan endo-1,4-beta-mannosidase
VKLRIRSAIATGTLVCATTILFGLLYAGQAAAQGHVALGIAINPPLNAALTEQYIQAAGAPPAVEMWFRDFDAPLFYSAELTQADSIGATPMVTWDPMANGSLVTYTEILSGAFDNYFKAQADYVASTHQLIYIRLVHEMNVPPPGTPWGPESAAGTPQQFILAWRHIVTIFRQQGATNARWVWAPNTDCNGACPFTAYYPGDAWVDDVGLDGYNFGAVHKVPWMSLQQIFQSSYNILTKMTTKPVMFTETASTGPGANKAAWITQGFLTTIPQLFPRVVEVTWWQRIDQTDWRVNSSPVSEAAWRAVVADPYYGGTGVAATAASSRHVRAARHDSKPHQRCARGSHGCTKDGRKHRLSGHRLRRTSAANTAADTRASRLRRQRRSGN